MWRQSAGAALQRPAAQGPDELSAHDLTVAGQAIVAHRLVCELTWRAALDDQHPQILCCAARFLLPVPVCGDGIPGDRDGLTVAGYCSHDLRVLQRLAAAGTDVGAGRSAEIQVGGASFVVLPDWNQATFDALDDQSWDLSAFGHLLRERYDDILGELQGQDPGSRSAQGPPHRASVVLVDQVGVESAWRGLGLGLIGTGLALRALGPGCAFAALYPMRPGLGSAAERIASRRQLTRHWSRLGFTHPYDNYLVLDLGTSDLDTAVARLTPSPAPADG